MTIVLVSLGWGTGLLANLFRLSLLPYCTVIKGRTKKHAVIYFTASDAKNTRQFLWDDNSKGLRSRGFQAECTQKEAKTPHTVDLNVYYESDEI